MPRRELIHIETKYSQQIFRRFRFYNFLDWQHWIVLPSVTSIGYGGDLIFVGDEVGIAQEAGDIPGATISVVHLMSTPNVARCLWMKMFGMWWWCSMMRSLQWIGLRLVVP